MRAIGIAEEIGRGCGDHRDINVDFSILDRLIAAAMRTQYPHASHFALRTIVAQRSVHRAFNVMDDAFLHQLDRALLRGKRRTREPHQIFDADSGRGFQRHERHFIAITQMMMVRNDHPVAQSAFAQRRLEIGHALVAAVRIIFIGSRSPALPSFRAADIFPRRETEFAACR